MREFTMGDIPNMSGKTILITGGNSGIGFQTAWVLAEKGARVIITCRKHEAGQQAVNAITRFQEQLQVSAEILDLASLASIRAFIQRFTPDKLDILINNAGVMNMPARTLTADGFEQHFGVNHLGHYALTLGLLPLLRKSTQARVVCVSALVAYNGVFDLDNLQSEKKYSPMGAYSQSKLANVLFANELGRREPGIISVALQPGSAMTNLQRYTAEPIRSIAAFLMKFNGQSVEDCALPSLYAATQPDVRSGMFFGPTGRFNRGSAGQRDMPKRALDQALARKLWDMSEELTGFHYNGE